MYHLIEESAMHLIKSVEHGKLHYANTRFPFMMSSSSMWFSISDYFTYLSNGIMSVT